MGDKAPTTPSSATRYEPFSTYYLHPSEGTGSVISPILLRGDNYEEWSRSLRNNLKAKNKLGFVDGTQKEPDAKSPDFNQWGIVNSMLVAWIYNTLDVSVRSTVVFPEHVKDLWDDLRDRYSLGNGPRIHEVKTQIGDCKQRGRPVAEYYGELRRLWDELAGYRKLPSCTCSAAAEYVKLQQTEMLHQFLIGLDSKKFGSAVSSLLLMDPLPSVSVAYSKVVSDERKQALGDAQEARHAAVGFVTGGAAQGRSVGARQTSPSGVNARVCSHCGFKGHEKDKCFELVGFPDWYSGRGGRGGRHTRGRDNGSRGGRGRGFAGNIGNARHIGVQDIGDSDRSSKPTLTDAQWAQLIAAFSGGTRN